MAVVLTAPDNTNFDQMGAVLVTPGAPADISIGMVLTAPDEGSSVGGGGQYGVAYA